MLLSLKQNLHLLLWLKRHLSGELKPVEFESVCHFLPEHPVCYDIGAHSGSWSYNLYKAYPNAIITSFEALPYYASILDRMFRLLSAKNVTIVPYAVEHHAGKVSLVWKDANGKRLTGLTHIEAPGGEDGEKIIVKAISLDEYWEDNGKAVVHFLKLDVEGKELDILKGSTNLLSLCRPIVFCETEERWCQRYKHSNKDIFNYFKSLDYVPMQMLDGRFEICDTASYFKNDLLFLPREKVSTGRD